MIWLLIASLLWGPSFGLIPILMREPGMNPYTLAFFRMAYALLLFLPLLRIHDIPRRKRVILVLIGAVQFGGMYVFLNLAYQYLRGYEVAMVTVFTPIYVTLLDGLFRKKHASVQPWICVILAVTGAMIIQYARPPESEGFWIGFGIMQIANLCFAFGQVAYRDLLPKLRKFGDMFVFGWLYFGGVLLTGAAFLLWGDPAQSLPALRNMSLTGWSILLWLGLVPSGLAFFLFNHGALVTNAATLSIFNNLKIPLAMIVVLLLFRQWDHISNWPRFLLGSGLMCAALAWNHIRTPRSRFKDAV
jgi:drug/metabolite transporter (DMT)-like permease